MFEKDLGLNGDLCDTGAVFYQLSCQANWELGHFQLELAAEVMGSNPIEAWFFFFQALISQLFKLCI